MSLPRCAILHDYFDELGGAELSLLHIARILDAEIYTTNVDGEKIRRLGFADVKINSVGAIPSARHLKQFACMKKFRDLELPGYSLYLFGGSYSIYAAKNHKPNIWYCFSPLRGLYDLREECLDNLHTLKKPVKELHENWDRDAQKQIQKIISSSQTVAGRVKKYYGRESTVIPCPADLEGLHPCPPGGYWLTISRITPYKRINLLLDAFQKMPGERLVVVGQASGEDKKHAEKLIQKSPDNVEFTGPVYEREKLAKIIMGSKGYVSAARGEDFGIAPIEAMACGKPVVATDEGGHRETVIDGETGILVQAKTGEIINAVMTVNQDPVKYSKACRRQAEKFSLTTFRDKLQNEVRQSQPEKRR